MVTISGSGSIFARYTRARGLSSLGTVPPIDPRHLRFVEVCLPPLVLVVVVVAERPASIDIYFSLPLDACLSRLFFRGQSTRLHLRNLHTRKCNVCLCMYVCICIGSFLLRKIFFCSVSLFLEGAREKRRRRRRGKGGRETATTHTRARTHTQKSRKTDPSDRLSSPHKFSPSLSLSLARLDFSNSIESRETFFVCCFFFCCHCFAFPHTEHTHARAQLSFLFLSAAWWWWGWDDRAAQTRCDLKKNGKKTEKMRAAIRYGLWQSSSRRRHYKRTTIYNTTHNTQPACDVAQRALKSERASGERTGERRDRRRASHRQRAGFFKRRRGWRATHTPPPALAQVYICVW